MLPTLTAASPSILAGLVVAATAWPVFLGFLIGGLPWVAPFFRGDRTRWSAFWATTVVSLWAGAAAVLLLMSAGGVSPATVGLRQPSVAGAFVAAFVILAFVAATLMISARNATPGPTAHGAIFFPHTRRERLSMVLVVAPTAAVCEEIVYRGFLFALLATAIGPWAANATQAVLFGFHHGGVKQGIPAFLTRFGIGLVFGLITIGTGTLTTAIALHYLVDAALALKPAAAVAAEQPA